MDTSNTRVPVNISYDASTGVFRVVAGSSEAHDTSLPLAIKTASFLVHGQRPYFTLAELLAQADPNAPENETAIEWERTAPVGHERIDE